MKVKIKFSDLRKLKDEKRYLKEKLEESNLKLDYAITNEKNLISEIKQKNNKLDDLTQEIKELNEENNVLTEENNKLKTYAERKQPKFWVGDKVRIKEYIGEEFTIGKMLFKNDVFLFSDTLGDYSLYEENELELVYEDISK